MPGFVRMAWRCGRKRTTAALPLPRSALLYWTPISTTSRLRWFSKERAGGRSATSRAFFRNSESLAEPHIAQWGLYDPHMQELEHHPLHLIQAQVVELGRPGALMSCHLLGLLQHPDV